MQIDTYILGSQNGGAWVTFPTTPEQLAQTMKQISVDSHGIVQATEYDIPEMPHLQGQLSEYVDLDSLNYMASLLKSAEPETMQKLDAVALLYQTVSPMDVIDIMQESNLQRFLFLPEIKNYEAVGEYHAEQERDDFADAMERIKKQNPHVRPYFEKLEECAELYIGERYANEVQTSKMHIISKHGYIELPDILNAPDKIITQVPAEHTVFDKAVSILSGNTDRENTDYVLNKVEEHTEEGYSFIDGRRNSGPKDAAAPSLKSQLQAAKDAAAKHVPCAHQPGTTRETAR